MYLIQYYHRHPRIMRTDPEVIFRRPSKQTKEPAWSQSMRPESTGEDAAAVVHVVAYMTTIVSRAVTVARSDI
jgi:hypothetical protein